MFIIFDNIDRYFFLWYLFFIVVYQIHITFYYLFVILFAFVYAYAYLYMYTHIHLQMIIIHLIVHHNIFMYFSLSTIAIALFYILYLPTNVYFIISKVNVNKNN